MKQELSKLEKLLRSIGNLYKWDMVITASVIVQNMAFNADTFEWDEFTPYLDLLKQMKEYNTSNHVLQWAYDEADMIISAHFMSLAEEESELNSFESTLGQNE